MQTAILKLLVPLGCLVFFSLIVLSRGDISKYKHRIKRKVVFSKSSKFFFRLNGKDNILNYTEIFAHGWTFRINYDLPESIPRRHQFFKRDVHTELDSVTDESTFSLYSCVLKYICEGVVALKTSEKCGLLCGIGNIITSTASMEAEFFKSFLDKCDYHVGNCPYLIGDSTLGFG